MQRRRIRAVVAIGSVLAVMTLGGAIGGAALAGTEGSTPAGGRLAGDNAAFAAGLYGRISAKPGNLFFSPYSISEALAMTYGGARGNTAAEMEKALRFELGQAQLHAAFAGLDRQLDAIQRKGKIQLRVANSLWPHKDYPFKADYLDLAKQHYGVAITPVDYVSAAKAARAQINRWVEQKTNEKIKDLIPAGALNAVTRMVLANAIYFKGNWAIQFKPERTADAPFHLAAGGTVNVPLMNQQEGLGYAEDGNLQALELPYAGNDLSMVVVLPRAVDGLPALEKALNAETIQRWMKPLPRREVEVFLPRFKMTAEFQLNEALAAMGMRDAFGAAADFTGMGGKPGDLFISAVLHKAFVEVNEEGTEAAAATGVAMVGAVSVPKPPPVFRADHPFLFLIRENSTGSILFFGRLENPKS